MQYSAEIEVLRLCTPVGHQIVSLDALPTTDKSHSISEWISEWAVVQTETEKGKGRVSDTERKNNNPVYSTVKIKPVTTP